ncbi:MAG: phosphoribosylglycinamide formyltransferase [Woeseiaceae bacterium]|nr:phosphoribosylglycinamide formyltransferase [Woeseiaceae bacterium]
MSRSRCKTAILISGSGSNLQSFIDRVAEGSINLDICAVFSNRQDAFGLERAQKAGIPTACIDHTAFDSREAFDRAAAAELDLYDPELLVLAGFMRILSPWFVRHYEGRILNIHPALLPLYPGLNTHQRAIDAGDTQHGTTVHFVTEELDGGPCILQGRLAIRRGESAEQLKDRIQAVEHQIYPTAAQLVADGDVTFRDGRAFRDGQPLDQPLLIDFPD